MKKTLLTIGLIVVLIVSLFALTACDKGGAGENEGAGDDIGRETTEVTYDAPSIYSIKFDVPTEDGEAVYEFVDEVPEAVSEIMYRASNILAGDKVVITFETSSYTYQTGVAYKEAHGTVEPSFEGFKEFINEEGSTSTLKGYEDAKIGEREALKTEYRQGSGKGDLYGYRYTIDISDLYPRGYFELNVVVADGNSESTEATFADPEVQAIIDSIVISALEG